MSDSLNEATLFHQHLNSLHRSLVFTMEEEKIFFSFLDVLVERKVKLIKTLVQRTLMICSSCTLQQELDRIRCILLNNGYPANIIKRTIEHKTEKFSKPPEFRPSLCLIYLKLPWLGRKHQILTDKDFNSIPSTYFSAKLRVALGPI